MYQPKPIYTPNYPLQKEDDVCFKFKGKYVDVMYEYTGRWTVRHDNTDIGIGHQISGTGFTSRTAAFNWAKKELGFTTTIAKQNERRRKEKAKWTKGWEGLNEREYLVMNTVSCLLKKNKDVTFLNIVQAITGMDTSSITFNLDMFISMDYLAFANNKFTVTAKGLESILKYNKIHNL